MLKNNRLRYPDSFYLASMAAPEASAMMRAYLIAAPFGGMKKAKPTAWEEGEILSSIRGDQGYCLELGIGLAVGNVIHVSMLGNVT